MRCYNVVKKNESNSDKPYTKDDIPIPLDHEWISGDQLPYGKKWFYAEPEAKELPTIVDMTAEELAAYDEAMAE